MKNVNEERFIWQKHGFISEKDETVFENIHINDELVAARISRILYAA